MNRIASTLALLGLGKTLLVVCLWLLSAGAFANGVPLFTPGPPIAADDPIHRDSKHIENFKRAHPIVLNSAAFGADVVTVEMNSKVHTFVMRQSNFHATGLSLWEGEENDDSFDKRPDILLRHSDKRGLSGDFFLPPRSFFHFASESPTILIEMEADVGVHRGPFWLIWLRLVGLLILFGCFVGFGGAFIWRWVKSRRSTAANEAPAPS